VKRLGKVSKLEQVEVELPGGGAFTEHDKEDRDADGGKVEGRGETALRIDAMALAMAGEARRGGGGKGGEGDRKTCLFIFFQPLLQAIYVRGLCVGATKD
jgi:hypothetical protein